MVDKTLERRIEKPIFIFGCCNSGTRILWQALKQHKDLSGPDVKGQFLEGIPNFMTQYLGKETWRLWAHPKFNNCYLLTEENYKEEDKVAIEVIYLSHLQPGKRFITKNPSDVLRARLIQAYFPDAYFVAIVRNGYAVSEGILRKRWYDPDRPEYKGLSTSIDEAAEQWSRANKFVVSNEKFLRKYKIIKYEELVENPEQTLGSVLDFCNLRKENFPIPLFTKNLNEQQIAILGQYEIETVTRIAQPMLIHFGYKVLQKELK